MPKKSVKINVQKPDLRVVEKPKTTSYNDIDLKNWKLYSHIKTGSLWEFASRDKTNGHSYDYHGNYIPQIATQLFERFTKKNDVILDLFFGSGTSGIEALNMERRCIGVELKQELVDYFSAKFSKKDLVTDINIICGDSTTDEAKEKVQARLEIMGKKQAQFVVLHPPYDDIIKFSDKKEDLSNCKTTEEFYDLFEKVAKNAYDLLEKGRFAALIIGDKNAYDLLEKGRFAALIIGDEYKNSRVVPLGFECMKRMENVGFITKAIVVKNITGNEKAKGKTANLWRYRALAGGFNIFEHEYIMTFVK